MQYMSEWSTFYATMGASAATLTGLVFIVITLISGTEWVTRGNPLGVSTFSTPTVMHFCVVLFVSGTIIAPWHSLTGLAIVVGAAGLFGVLYSLRVMHLTTRLDREMYVPDLEDWMWFNILPFVGYAAILGGALAMPAFPSKAPFAVAAGTLLLVFIGIRNAWDVVTYIVVTRRQE